MSAQHGYSYSHTMRERHTNAESLPASFARGDVVDVSDASLRRLLRSGQIVRLARGIYRRADAPPADEDLLQVALSAPDATLCLTSALAHHGLSDEIPTRIDVALPRPRRPPRLDAPVRWHRFAVKTYALGRTTMVVADDARLGLYSPERCIVDAFRLQHLEGEAVAVTALRRWLERPDSTPSALLTLARAFPKAERSVLHALRILL